MTVGTRTEFARAALLDMGRPDLAGLLVSPSSPDREDGAVSWFWRDDEMPRSDYVLFLRAAALASLSEGYDERNIVCERCVLAEFDPRDRCRFVTRRELLAHVDCARWQR